MNIKNINFLKGQLFLKAAFILLSYACYGQLGSSGTTIPSNARYRHDIGYYIPLGALPMQYNSSFAGEAGEARISSNISYETSRIFNGGHMNLMLSFDQFIPVIGSGIGITAGYGNPAMADLEGGSTFLNIGIAPKFSIGGKFTISPSLNINYDQSDQRLRNIPCVNSSGNPVDCWKKSQFIASDAAILLNSRKFYIGYSVQIFSQIKYHQNEFDLPVYFKSGFQSNLQSGYTFESAGSNFSFTPQVVIGIGQRHYYNWYGEFWYRDNHFPRYFYRSPIGIDKFVFTFRYKKILWGISDVGPQIGWQSDKLRFLFSNNLNLDYQKNILGYITGWKPNSPEGNLSNFSLRYLFNSNDNRKRNWQ